MTKKKKNTRDYGKFKGGEQYQGRENFADGGFVDAFGDPVIAHYNRAGGITEGPDPDRRPLVKPGRVSGIYCYSEDSTFNRGDPKEAAAYLRQKAERGEG